MKLKSTEERIHILDSSSRSNVWPVITDIADSGVQEEAFYVCDLGDIVRKHKIWKALMPRVHPHYAVKCNDSITVLEILAHMGVAFDCASKGEINKVLSLGVEPSRIVFANPAKVASHIRYACATNVNLTTFDNEAELYKIKSFHPKTKLLIRIRCDAEDAQVMLGLKYGCDAVNDTPRLLEVARELGLDVVGVSFHVGSGCREPEAYRRAIAASKYVFDLANAYGYDFDILDIGGGFPGEKDANIDKMAEVINDALTTYFPSPLVRVIAEPGRYYVSSAFTLTCNIHSIRDVFDASGAHIRHKMYYINDGIYSSFNCLLYDNQVAHPLPLHVAPSGVKWYSSSVWGPTCDSLDRVCEEVALPEMRIGDWLVFEEMGAYTLAIASTFNGFPIPKVHLVADEAVWALLKDVVSAAEEMSVTTNNMKWKKIRVDDPNLKSFGLAAIEECLDYNSQDLKKPVKRKKPPTEKNAKKPKTEITPSKSGCSFNSIEPDNNFGGYEEWTKFALQDPLIQAIRSSGFKEPTRIQSLTLPAAILGHRDILGAAETGSGKTLAFGLPILSGILSEKEKRSDLESRPLYALILTPTRELAIQVKNHLVDVAKFTDINVAVVVGGMAAVKQERILGKGPEIVVATPGRLWELFQEGNSHLSQIDSIRYLAIDETDRMLEKGHFEELHNLLERLNENKTNANTRQNFVFSATLTSVHDVPKYLKNKTKVKKMTAQQKLQKIIDTLGIKNPKIVDITQEGNSVPETLTESRISCAFEEKDYYVYYFLQKHPGRTLIFCNSIGCVKRLANLLGILECKPLPLHASMQQRQRLKNLEKFKENDRGVLIATDVAARGLDIPNVEHVLHYQIPRTSESYIHRSGRTARASKSGLTLLLMEPSEIKTYIKLCQTLNKSEDLPLFPVQEGYLRAVKERVVLARDIDKLELEVRKGNSEEGWLQKAAKDMDMIVDDFVTKYDKEETNQKKKPVAIKRKQLAVLLNRPIFPIGFSGKYLNNIENFTTSLDIKSTIENVSKEPKKKNKQIPLFKPRKNKNK